MDRPPRQESAPTYAPPPEERPAPLPAEAPAPVIGAQEPPRRRSTIREPAPFAAESAPAPPSNIPLPTPVISSTGAEETSAPKRGWWGKRLLGDKD